MTVQGNSEKYVCLDCKRKIGTEDLEEIFASQLGSVETRLPELWEHLTEKEKRIIIEQSLGQIIVGRTDIQIEFAYSSNSLKTPDLWQQKQTGNETSKSQSSNQNGTALTEPLMNEIEAARFLGISRMTLLRKRNAREIGFFRVGFRVLYSKEKHLLPFLESCESK